MRILALADEPDARLWSERCKEMLEGTDLILSAGDLPSSYLSYLTCFTHAPILYVRGNHDASYAEKPPEGCTCVDGRVVNINGVRVLGLGGSMRYRPSGCMYTEEEMRARIRGMGRQLRAMRGFDILLTHAPVKDLGDQPDLAHRGFACFAELIRKYRPAVMFHGHVHQAYTASFVRIRDLDGVPVINACGSWFFDLPDDREQQKPRWYAGALEKKIGKKMERASVGQRKQL